MRNDEKEKFTLEGVGSGGNGVYSRFSFLVLGLAAVAPVADADDDDNDEENDDDDDDDADDDDDDDDDDVDDGAVAPASAFRMCGFLRGTFFFLNLGRKRSQFSFASSGSLASSFLIIKILIL